MIAAKTSYETAGRYQQANQQESRHCGTCAPHKLQAATALRQGNGFVYVQHPHKAGGSTFCSLLSGGPLLKLGIHMNCNPIILPQVDSSGTTARNLTMSMLLKHVWRAVPDNWTVHRVQAFLRHNQRNVLVIEDQPLQPWWRAATAPPNAWTFLTILRDPVSRTLSHHRFERIKQAFGWNVSEWAHRAPYYTQNFYVRTFAPLPPPSEAVDAWNPILNWAKVQPLSTADKPARFLSTWTGAPAVDGVHMQRAMETLRRFSVVLVLEFFEECAALLSRWLGVPVADLRPRSWKGELSSPRKMSQGAEAWRRTPWAKALEQLNRHDRALYDTAVSCLRQNIEANFFYPPGLCRGRSSSSLEIQYRDSTLGLASSFPGARDVQLLTPHDSTDDWYVTNPCITMRPDGKLLAVMRRLRVKKGPRGRSMWFSTIVSGTLDPSSLDVGSSAPVVQQFSLLQVDTDSDANMPRHCTNATHANDLAVGPEDPRVFVHGKLVYLLYFQAVSTLSQTRCSRVASHVRPWLAPLAVGSDNVSVGESHMVETDGLQHEKNWSPFEFSGDMLMSRSFQPHVVIRCSPNRPRLLCEEIYRTSHPRLRILQNQQGLISGGSPAILVPAPSSSGSTTGERNVYLTIVHMQKRRQYVNLAVTYEARPPFAITHLSEPLPLKCPPRKPKVAPNSSVCFVTGLVLTRGKIIVSYGAGDAEARLWTLPWVAFRDGFMGQGADIASHGKTTGSTHGVGPSPTSCYSAGSCPPA